MISIHMLMSIQPRLERTMQVYVDINNKRLTTLLDSSSAHNFVDIEAMTRVGLTLQLRVDLHVAVANDDRLTSPGCCQDLRN
jgi:hypothetical protein